MTTSAKTDPAEAARDYMSAPRADLTEISRHLRLLVAPGAVHELRVPKAGRDGTVSGYFDDPDKLAAAAAQRSGKAPAIYLTLNPVNPALLARAVNKTKARVTTATLDIDVLKRLCLLIDCDPLRPKDISSTEAEHQAALDRVRVIRDWLTDQGWPLPVLADSGNGGHLLYRVDLPNDAAATALVRTCLEVLAQRFDDAVVIIDKTVFNASRISKLYGTLTCKGDSTADRPHRIARILEAPEPLYPVSQGQLAALAAILPKKPEPKPRTHSNGSTGSLFSDINQAAIARLADWVPALFPKARPYQGGYRVSSLDLGRALEEDLSLLPAGIRDFGQEDGLTPIDTVMRFNGCAVPTEAAQWLAGRLGMELAAPALPGSLDGWNPGEPPAQGARSGAGQDDNDAADDFDAHVPAPRPTEVMLYGLAGAVGQIAAETTEANRYAVAAGFLAFLSAACGRDIYLPVGNVWHHARLFTLHVGRSAIARKQEALSLAHRIRRAIEDQDKGLLGQMHTGGLSSREGLAFLIHDGYKEGKQEVEPIHDKRLWIVESEFANVLHQSKRDGNTLSSALRDAWDGISIKPAVKHQRLWATDPHIALSGQITPGELLAVIEHRELSNGFANRFLIFWAEREKLVPSPAATPQETVNSLAERTAAVIRFAKGQYPHTKDRRRASLAPSAKQLYEELYRAELAQPLESELLSALLERRAPYLLRLALLFALTDQTLMIEVKHIEAALAWVRYCTDSVRFIFAPLADVASSEGCRKVAEKILAYLRDHREADRRTLLHDCLARHVSAARLDKALDGLLAETPPRIEVTNQERRDGQPGRGSKVYRLSSNTKATIATIATIGAEQGQTYGRNECDHSDHSMGDQNQAGESATYGRKGRNACDHSESLAVEQRLQRSQRSHPPIEKTPGDPEIPEEVF